LGELDGDIVQYGFHTCQTTLVRNGFNFSHIRRKIWLSQVSRNLGFGYSERFTS
jgi:hypothetical protein